MWKTFGKKMWKKCGKKLKIFSSLHWGLNIFNLNFFFSSGKGSICYPILLKQALTMMKNKLMKNKGGRWWYLNCRLKCNFSGWSVDFYSVKLLQYAKEKACAGLFTEEEVSLLQNPVLGEDRGDGRYHLKNLQWNRRGENKQLRYLCLWSSGFH